MEYTPKREIIEKYMMLAPKKVPLSDDDIVAMVMEDRYGNESIIDCNIWISFLMGKSVSKLEILLNSDRVTI